MPSEGSGPNAEELAVKAVELEVRRQEASKALASLKSPWWRRADPLLLAVIAGVITLIGNLAVTITSGYTTYAQERDKAKHDQELEQTKAKYNLVLQAMATNNADTARRNIHFFIDAALLQDSDCRIRDAIDQDQPVLPSLSGTAPPLPSGLHSPPEIALLYNFPSGYDGRGVTVGLIELGGKIVPTDVDTYFKSLSLPPPDISAVTVGPGSPDQGSAELDGQVMMDIEIIGALAPRARIRVYFARSESYARAIKKAVDDGVAVISTAWGSIEANWKDEELREVDAALEDAAKHNITVIAASGDNGVTDGGADRRHVDFPASSQWVLAVGGARQQ